MWLNMSVELSLFVTKFRLYVALYIYIYNILTYQQNTKQCYNETFFVACGSSRRAYVRPREKPVHEMLFSRC